MLEVSIRADFSSLERALMAMKRELPDIAARAAVARTAALSRTAINRAMPDIFDRPTPMTARAVLFKVDPAARAATLFVRDEASKGTAPSQYLAAEIRGGPRRDKRSERALIARGLMEPDQQAVPGRGARLDAFGNIPGSAMVRILSRVKAFGEMGFSANLSEATKRRLRKQGLATRRSGTDYFVGRDREGRPRAIYHLVGPGDVRPVLVFTDRRARYRKRFDFVGLAHRHFAENWPTQMRRAFYETMEKLGLKSK